MSAIKYVLTSFIVVIASFATTIQAMPNDDSAILLLHKADSLYRMGSFERAAEIYLQAAEKGNAEAQFDIGYAYYTGEGISRNYTSAAMWFKRSAKQNFAKAQYNLAYCYMNGRGVPCDYDKAFNYLNQSAENDYKRAQITLADCYTKGVLVEQDEELGKKWYARAEGSKVEAQTEVVDKPQTATTDNAQTAVADKPQTAKTDNTQAEEVDNSKEVAVSKKETLTDDFTIEVDIPGEEKADNSVKVNKVESAQPTATAQVKAATVAVSPNLIPGPKQLQKLNGQANVSPAPATSTTPAVSPAPVASPASAASTKMPPTLKILYPEDQSLFHTDQLKLKYQLLSNGCPDSTRVVVMVDGQRQPTTRAVRAANTIDVDLPRHDCTVMMYAQNSNGNSEPAVIRLVRESTSFELPKLFVVAIGVGDYNDPKLPKLRFTCKDAQDFAKVIATKKGLPYEDVQVKVLCDSEATRADIFEAMEWLKQESSPNDVCIFFYAGHGMRDEKDRFYFMPYGCNSSKLYECFSAADFRNEAEDINGKLIAFVDACYSGALFEGGRSAATAHFVEQLKRSKNGMLLYASSSSDTKSREDESWGNGAFTKSLVAAFNGGAKEEHTEGLSTQELEHFLYKEVRKLTDFKQTPIFINPNGVEHFNLFNYEK